MLAGLLAGPAAAQQPPGYRPAAVYGSPYPTTAGQPNVFARPAAPQPQAAPAPQPTGTTGRPNNGPPPGYRPVGGSAQPAAKAASAGQVMYFHKPANALAADGMADAGAVAQVSAPPVLAPVSTDAPVAAPALPPAVPAVTERPLPAPVPVPVPSPVFTSQPVFQEPAVPQPAAQPKTATPKDTVPLPPEVTRLPGRDKIFMMYDDESLRRAILEQAKKNKVGVPIEFPVLPPVAPPGTTYVSRTGTQPPLQVVYESGFVVHRRLHFEEKNSERYGWDLGPLSPVVSTMAFYRDVLLWPNSLASGIVTGFWDTSAGKCLPGSPVPYLWYPPELTLTGTAAEALVITGAAFVIP
ncbi:MAG: hypothetical protein U0804_13145 [Gemmataceae bacterium]